MRIQAKRLSALSDGKKDAKIAHRSYHELLHKPPSSSEYQFETLIAAPYPWVPLYMFYNHQSVVEDTYFKSAGPSVSGVNLAFATDIATELATKIIAAKATPKAIKHHKRLDHLREHLFGLDAILCPASYGGAGVPPPDAVSLSLRNQWVAQGTSTAHTEEVEAVQRILSEPTRLLAGRDREWHIADGPAIRVDRALKRPVMTFISGRTADERTPVISDDIDRGRR